MGFFGFNSCVFAVGCTTKSVKGLDEILHNVPHLSTSLIIATSHIECQKKTVFGLFKSCAMVKSRYGVITCAMVKSRCIGDGHPTFNRNPYNGYINPYYWVDDHPLLYWNNAGILTLAHMTPTQTMHDSIFRKCLRFTSIHVHSKPLKFFRSLQEWVAVHDLCEQKSLSHLSRKNNNNLH